MKSNKKEKNHITSASSFKILATLNQKLDERVVADGYGMRGKSRWVREAIENLLANPDCGELVSLSDEAVGKTNSISVRLPQELFLEMEKEVIDIRRNHPEIEGIKSKIVRTAIIQRLIRS